MGAGPLLERSEQLARIEAALAETRSGRGTLVGRRKARRNGQDGAAGCGAGGRARERHARASRPGTELERDFAFGVVRQLFGPALADPPEAERAELLQGAAGNAAGLLALPGAALPDHLHGPGVDPSYAILHGLYWLCANLAAAGPLFLVVDDAHWVDAPLAPLPGLHNSRASRS